MCPLRRNDKHTIEIFQMEDNIYNYIYNKFSCLKDQKCVTLSTLFTNSTSSEAYANRVIGDDYSQQEAP